MQTLICDATGDAELLKAIWPDLERSGATAGRAAAAGERTGISDRRSLDQQVGGRAVEGQARQKEGDLERKGESAPQDVCGAAIEGDGIRRR